ncbi:hypothetical protein [Rubritalea tangerina]|uniref:hypothetical protein n=1 Tax=Rubritalea tangerina TaxID=430798 RepID=UPI003624152F
MLDLLVVDQMTSECVRLGELDWWVLQVFSNSQRGKIGYLADAFFLSRAWFIAYGTSPSRLSPRR